MATGPSALKNVFSATEQRNQDTLVSAAAGKLASVRDCSQAGFPYFFRTNTAGGQSKT
jgi:hypothetical protein